MPTNKKEGVDYVTDTERLEKVIHKSGLKKGYISEKLGISRYSLIKKINNVVEFKASEIDGLCKILDVSDSREKELIFFAVEVGKMTTKE